MIGACEPCPSDPQVYWINDYFTAPDWAKAVLDLKLTPDQPSYVGDSPDSSEKRKTGEHHKLDAVYLELQKV